MTTEEYNQLIARRRALVMAGAIVLLLILAVAFQ